MSAAVVALGGLAVVTGPAGADTAPPVAGTPATVSSDPLPTVQVNGVVWDQTMIGNTVYATGSFSRARPPGAAPGTNETPRANLLSYDVTTGQLNTAFNPRLNATGYALAASADGQTLYVGGSFTDVNGARRNRVAALDPITGALRNTVTNGTNASVRALAVSGTTLYFGGVFSTAGGLPRTRLAAINTATNTYLSWAPRADATVNSLAYHPGTNKVFVAGRFDTVNGTTNPGVAALNGATGAVLPFPTNQITLNSASRSGGIWRVRVAGNVVYGTGWGTQQTSENVFAADTATGNLIYISGCTGDTYDALPVGDVVYWVSHAHNCSFIGGFPEQRTTFQQRAAAYRLAPVPGKTNVGRYSGRPAPELLHWFPNLQYGSYTGQNQAAWSVTGNSQYISLGGEFPSVNGQRQQGLVRYAVRANAANTDGPRGVSSMGLSVSDAGGGTMRASFATAHDRDNTRLTYQLLRGPTIGTSSVVATRTADSNWWTTPRVTLDDTSAPPGTSQSYRIKIVDPLGNIGFTEPVTVQVPAGGGGGGGGGGGQTNLALGKPTAQSSTYLDQGITPAVSARAVDGNTSGVFSQGSVTHTRRDPNAWWHVDLESRSAISTVTVYNRTDCCSERLNNAYLLVSDNPITSPSLTTARAQAGVSSYPIVRVNGSLTIPVNRTGRYLRIQLAGTEYLSLAEVVVNSP